jgi:protein TilB
LDLTLNFIGIESLECSVDELVECGTLEELFLTGNPCMGVGDGGEAETSLKNVAGWSGCRPYVIARLVNLKYLDGKEVKRSERIAAMQKLPKLIEELHTLAAICIKEQQTNRSEVDVDDKIDDDAPTHHNPETRTKLSNEMYEQKQSKEKQESAHLVKQKGEKEWEEEQRATVQKVREREVQDCGSNELKPNGEIKQCNQGKYQFHFQESDTTSDKGALIMHIALPKHLSTSLIDVDIHPTYVSVVIKSKVLRVVLPVEVLSDASEARRIAATGALELVMPKASGERAVGMPFVRETVMKDKEAPRTTTETMDSAGGKDVGQKRLGYTIIQEAVTIESLRGIVLRPSILESDDEDEPPPLW